MSSIKVIGGVAKGARLYSLNGAKIRPALASVKKSVFDILCAKVVDAGVADLFAGTGSVGIEALSRGARSCIFVENDAECAQVIAKNLNKLRLEDVSSVIRTNAFYFHEFAEKNAWKFDLIFINPPYRFFDLPAERRMLDALIAGAAQKALLEPDGQIIIEHRRGQMDGACFDGMRLDGRRDYGETQVTFFS